MLWRPLGFYSVQICCSCAALIGTALAQSGGAKITQPTGAQSRGDTVSKLQQLDDATGKMNDEIVACMRGISSPAASREGLQSAIRRIKGILEDPLKLSGVPNQIKGLRQEIAERRNKIADLDSADRAELSLLLDSLEQKVESVERKHVAVLNRLIATKELLGSWSQIYDLTLNLTGEADADSVVSRLAGKELQKNGIKAAPTPPAPTPAVSNPKSGLFSPDKSAPSVPPENTPQEKGDKVKTASGPPLDPSLESQGIRRGFLGVSLQEITPGMAREFGVSPGAGALVNEVQPDSPAQKYGIRPYDVIVEINGQSVKGGNDLQTAIARLAPGTPARIHFLRDRRFTQIVVTLGSAPANLSGPVSPPMEIGKNTPVQPIRPMPPSSKASKGGERNNSVQNAHPSLSLEAGVLREYYHALEMRDVASVVKCLADFVDYYDSGRISRAKVLEDIKGDWGRYRNVSYQVTNINPNPDGSWVFLLEYHLLQGDLPRTGMLRVSTTFSDEPQPRLQSISAKVIRAR